ncbi:MAG: hypothetical protein HY232_03000 [Acidobacteria bacterium]|nr:hypothetical protein [Acidobacteriota bacterium]
MMATAKELLDAGKLREAIDQLISEVKANPTEERLRTFLFELLCFAGQWDRAEKQLEVIAHQSSQAQLGVQVYINNLKAERDRQRLFSDGLQPHFLTEPPAYVDHLLGAINRMREGNGAAAREQLDKAEEERPALCGRFNGRPFEDFRDCHDLFGPILELIVKEKYTWLPFEQIRQIEIAPPKQLRDLLWTPARIEASDGTLGEVYLPALYPGSSEHPNDQVKLGRRTEWKKSEKTGMDSAYGLRLFLIGEEDKTILEVRTLQFGAPDLAS